MAMRPGDNDKYTNAEDLGTFNSGRRLTKFQGHIQSGRDNVDMLKFRVTGDADVTIHLRDLSGNADLELRNSSGVLIGSSKQLALVNERIDIEVPAGTYFIRVLAGPSSVGSYELWLETYVGAADANDETESNNRYTSAENLGSFSSDNEVVFNGHVGVGSDNVDMMRFEVTEDATVTIGLSDLTENLKLELRNSGGVLLGQSNRSGLLSESITRTLTPGVYFIRVLPAARGLSGAYKLTLDIAVGGGSPDYTETEPNNTRLSADRIGPGLFQAGSGAHQHVITGNVGTTNDSIDYFTFTTEAATDVRLRVDASDIGIRVTLRDADGNVIKESAEFGRSTAELTHSVVAGTYYVTVTDIALSDRDYTLTVNLDVDGGSSPNPTPQDSDNNDTIANADDLGRYGGSAGAQSFRVSGTLVSPDSVDFFRFELLQSTTLSLSINTLTQSGIELALYDASGSLIQREYTSGKNADFSRSLAAGTYFIRLNRFGSSSTYTLNGQIS